MSSVQSGIEAVRATLRNAEKVTFDLGGQTFRKPSVHKLPKSQKSQESRPIDVQFGLSELEAELFEERAAVLEYDGGMPRRTAETRALTLVLGRRYRTEASR